MTFCRGSPPKHRTSKPHGGHSHGSGKGDYGHGMRGHSYVKLFKIINKINICIGRRCSRCGREWLKNEDVR